MHGHANQVLGLRQVIERHRPRPGELHHHAEQHQCEHNNAKGLVIFVDHPGHIAAEHVLQSVEPEQPEADAARQHPCHDNRRAPMDQTQAARMAHYRCGFDNRRFNRYIGHVTASLPYAAQGISF